MNNIKAIYDFSSNQWQIDADAFTGSWAEVQIIFKSVNPMTVLPQDFKFGFTVTKDQDLLISKQYPENIGKFEAADSYPLAIESIYFVPEHKYKIYVWLKSNAQITEYTQEITAGRLPQPFPSWTWNNGFWIPPVPKPVNGPYDWNEAQQQWVPLFAPDSPYAQMPAYGDEQFSPELGRMVKALNDEHHQASPLGSPGVEIKLDPKQV